MLKLFAKKLKNNTFSFYESDNDHVKKVLRLKINDEVLVTYEEKKYLTRIINLEPLITMIINEIQTTTKGFSVDLYQAIIKPKKFEQVFKESAQLDIDNFFPVLFNRTQSQYDKEIRLNKISIANSKQANRLSHLTINPTIKSTDLVDKLLSNNYDLIVIPYENCQNEYLSLEHIKSSFKKIAIIIGPEGGFEETEIKNLLKLSNVKIIRLTNTILRSETAAIYTISIVSNYMLLLRSL